MKNESRLSAIVDVQQYPLGDSGFRSRCKAELDDNGVLTLKGFLLADAVDLVRQEGHQLSHLAFYTQQDHNVYLAPPDPDFSDDHPRNRAVISSKGCITDDQIPSSSPLHLLYDSALFRSFLCEVLGESRLYEYADPLSSVNLHYASRGQELGWHFDNSSFAITLMIQAPQLGGQFEYVGNVRDADVGEMNFSGVNDVLEGRVPVMQLVMQAGDLVLFRGRNAIHRVAPVEGDTTRMLVVLAYNTEPDIPLSESARMTFYGRLD